MQENTAVLSISSTSNLFTPQIITSNNVCPSAFEHQDSNLPIKLPVKTQVRISDVVSHGNNNIISSLDDNTDIITSVIFPIDYSTAPDNTNVNDSTLNQSTLVNRVQSTLSGVDKFNNNNVFYDSQIDQLPIDYQVENNQPTSDLNTTNNPIIYSPPDDTPTILPPPMPGEAVMKI